MKQNDELIYDNIRLARQHLEAVEALLEESMQETIPQSFLADIIHVSLRNVNIIREKMRVASNLTQTKV